MPLFQAKRRLWGSSQPMPKVLPHSSGNIPSWSLQDLQLTARLPRGLRNTGYDPQCDPQRSCQHVPSWQAPSWPHSLPGCLQCASLSSRETVVLKTLLLPQTTCEFVDQCFLGDWPFSPLPSFSLSSCIQVSKRAFYKLHS